MCQAFKTGKLHTIGMGNYIFLESLYNVYYKKKIFHKVFMVMSGSQGVVV